MKTERNTKKRVGRSFKIGVNEFQEFSRRRKKNSQRRNGPFEAFQLAKHLIMSKSGVKTFNSTNSQVN
jgi:hypothetical protein